MRDLDIRISPFQFIQLLKCDLYCSVNQHAKAYVEAIISADDEDAYVEMALEEIVAEISCADDAGEDVTLLKGLVTDLSIDSRNGLKQLNLTIRSATVLMDLVEYTRTYQNPGFMMSNILDSIGYPHPMRQGHHDYIKRDGIHPKQGERFGHFGAEPGGNFRWKRRKD